MTTHRQTLFDTAARGLIEQGEPALDPDTEHTRCMYRTPHNNLKCAVGMLIPDEKYDRSFEYKNLRDVITETGIATLDDAQFLSDMQGAHDQHYTVSFSSWRTEMFEVAKKYDLNTNVFAAYPPTGVDRI